MSTSKKIQLPEGVTPEMAAAAAANPGEVITNAGRLSTEPRAHVPISGYGSNIRPNADVPRVTAPNISKYNQADAARRLAVIEQEEAAAKERESLQSVIDPVLLNATLQAMTRKIARLEKQFKEQSNGN